MMHDGESIARDLKAFRRHLRDCRPDRAGFEAKIADAGRPSPRLPTLTLAPKTRRPRKPSLVSVAKQASKAKIAVRAYEVRSDGTVVVVAGPRAH
jgi:hypothetical protein